MYTFLVLLISLLALLLIVIILIQSGKGGGLAASFGGASSSTESFMGGRQTATVLTKLTWAGGWVFLGLALILTVMATRIGEAPDSVLWEGLGPSPEVPADPTSVLESERLGEPPAGVPGQEPGAGPPDGGGP